MFSWIKSYRYIADKKFNFCKNALPNIERTSLLHFKTCFSSIWSILYLVGSNSKTQCRMTLTFFTREVTGLLTKMILWIFIFSLFLNYKAFCEDLWKKNIKIIFLSVLSHSKWKRWKKNRQIFVEILDETVCSYHVTYTFQSESAIYSCLNVNKLLAWNGRDIWSISDFNRIRIHNHLVRKQTFNLKSVSVRLRTKWLWVRVP